MRIVVGTKSQIKLEAVLSAFNLFGMSAKIVLEFSDTTDNEILGVSSSSGVPEQPWDVQTVVGAQNRAHAGKERGLLRDDADMSFGIESGVFIERPSSSLMCIFTPALYLDKAIVIVRRGEREYLGSSAGIQFPTEYVEETKRRILAGEKDLTVGKVIAEKLGGDHADPYATLTQGRVTRTATLIPGISIALAQALFGDDRIGISRSIGAVR